MSHGPIDEAVRLKMNAIANVIGDALPQEYGFTLLVFPIGKHPGNMNYISSAERSDMLTAMKELIANFEGRGHKPPRGKQ
jgi:hypothetical protein